VACKLAAPPTNAWLVGLAELMATATPTPLPPDEEGLVAVPSAVAVEVVEDEVPMCRLPRDTMAPVEVTDASVCRVWSCVRANAPATAMPPSLVLALLFWSCCCVSASFCVAPPEADFASVLIESVDVAEMSIEAALTAA